MGGLMAASTLPRVAVSPMAGVVVDRSDRRLLLIWMDVIRGLAVVLVAVEALLGTLQVWMVFAAGIIISASFIIAMICAFPLIFLPSFKRFIRFDPQRDTLESVR